MRNKSHIAILLTSIIFFVATLVVAWLLYGWTQKKHFEVEAAQAASKAEEERRSQVTQLERILEEIKGERAQLDSHFARSLDVVPLLDNLEKIATSVSATAEVSSVDRTEEGQSLVVGIKVTGSWSAIYKFIGLLENSPYELEFTMLDIKKAFTTEEGTGMWEGFFKVKVTSFLP